MHQPTRRAAAGQRTSSTCTTTAATAAGAAVAGVPVWEHRLPTFLWRGEVHQQRDDALSARLQPRVYVIQKVVIVRIISAGVTDYELCEREE